MPVFANAQTNLYSTQNQALPENALLKEDSLQSAFNNLDKSKIETGLLLDAAVEFADLKKYNGVPTDSSYTSAKIIGDIYNTLVMSRIFSNQGTLSLFQINGKNRFAYRGNCRHFYFNTYDFAQSVFIARSQG